MKKFKWIVKVEMTVDETWVADGFDLSEKERIEQIEENFTSMLPYAYGHEVHAKVTILSTPDKEKIRSAQGY